MKEWDKSIQDIILRIDENINKQNDASLTLKDLSKYLGYSEFYVSRKFKKISSMSLRDYLRYRKLAFALKDVRDTNQSLLSIAVKYGFSSHEAFTRAFKSAYDKTPSEYRNNHTCVVLRTIIKPFDCYLLETKEQNMVSEANDIKVYFVTIPAHKFLHIRNYESNGPFDFEKENALVEAKIEKAMKDFDYKSSGYELDLTQGRVFYFYHDTKRFWKYIRLVKKVK